MGVILVIQLLLSMILLFSTTYAEGMRGRDILSVDINEIKMLRLIATPTV